MGYELMQGTSANGEVFFVIIHEGVKYIWESIDDVSFWMEWPKDWQMVRTSNSNRLTFLLCVGREIEETFKGNKLLRMDYDARK